MDNYEYVIKQMKEMKNSGTVVTKLLITESYKNNKRTVDIKILEKKHDGI